MYVCVRHGYAHILTHTHTQSIYINIYIYFHIHIHIYTHRVMAIDIDIYICIYIYIYIYIYIHIQQVEDLTELITGASLPRSKLERSTKPAGRAEARSSTQREVVVRGGNAAYRRLASRG